jgi:NADPH-dependent ferric siderophore reductase
VIDIARRPAVLAAELARRGADVVVVGGTARWLRGAKQRPRDLDVVVDPASVPALVDALESLAVPVHLTTLLRCRDVRIDTPWGPLDVFVGPRPTSSTVLVEGVQVATLAAR